MQEIGLRGDYRWQYRISHSPVNRFSDGFGVADMIKQVKDCSFHLDTHQIKPGEFFKWQGS
ncbi:hypothetical protein E5S67_02754 [Microcoleus sp. IPMA8]|uniref:Uncharacterized protein n=1 Tax=Microcoleus asticus IPMA8 TaxID=2563858 RepID=A0ABX2CZJ7_9CYAN|nr:hypothetical protein [Microcoleus asticus IPMA8]